MKIQEALVNFCHSVQTTTYNAAHRVGSALTSAAHKVGSTLTGAAQRIAQFINETVKPHFNRMKDYVQANKGLVFLTVGSFGVGFLVYAAAQRICGNKEQNNGQNPGITPA